MVLGNIAILLGSGGGSLQPASKHWTWQHHSLFTCRLDRSASITLKEYACRNRDNLIDSMPLPGEKRYTSKVTRNELKLILRRAYHLLKNVHGAGLTLGGNFSAKDFRIDDYRQLKFGDPVVRPLKDRDADEDEHMFVHMVKREVFSTLPANISDWLLLVDGCDRNYDELKLQHINLMDEHQCVCAFMSMYDTLQQMKGSQRKKMEYIDNAAHNNVINELDRSGKYLDWKTRVGRIKGNTFILETIKYRELNNPQDPEYPDGVTGALQMLRNCRQHSTRGHGHVFARIICREFPGLMEDFQKAMFREGYLSKLNLKYTMY